MTDNAIDPDLKYRKKKEKKFELKMKEKQIKNAYDKLDNIAQASGKENPEFKDPRVYELWALARRANMSDEELESFKVIFMTAEWNLEASSFCPV